MKISKRWLLALAVTLGCATPLAALADDISNDPSFDSRTAFRAPVSPAGMPEGIAPEQQTQALPPVTLTVQEQPVANGQQAPQQAVIQQVSSTSSFYAEQAPGGQLVQQASTSYAAVDQPVPPPEAAPMANGGGSCGTAYWCPNAMVVATVEATFFWPQMHRQFLSTNIINTLGNNTIQSNNANGSVDGAFLAAPRITLGVQGECWGLVGRYWNASPWATAFTPGVPTAAPIGVTAFDTFRAYTFDLEAQRRFCAGNWTAYGFGGVRYAMVDNDRSLSVFNSFGGTTLSSSAFASQQFGGTGLTFGFQAFRPLGNCDCSPWSLFVANRYSTLWGHGATAVQTNALADTPGVGNANGQNGAQAKGNSSLFIAEVQLGVQWSAPLKCLPGVAFLRTAGEFQYWDTDRSAVAGSTTTAFVGNNSTTATANAGDLLFSMVGFNIGAGIMY